MRRLSLLLIACGFAFLSSPGMAHPIPDIPVRSFFETDGAVRLDVEIDIRCFAEDPETEPYLQHWVLKEMTEEEKEAFCLKASALVKSSISFHMEPKGEVTPEFEWRFTSHRGEALDAIDDPVMLTGTWKPKFESKPTSYRIEALPAGELSVLFLNHVNDAAVKKFQVLFPGEKSYRLDLAQAPEPGRQGE